MTTPLRLSVTTVVLLALSAGPAGPAAAHPAAAQRNKPAKAADIAHEFSALAQQRPWQCAVAAPSHARAPAASAQPDQCAWQERLRMRRWTSAGAPQGAACVSEQARLWSWARSLPGALPGQARAWRSHWQSNSVQGRNGAEEFTVIVSRAPEEPWRATEWRWNPSPRAATRRWQAGRWALLGARATQLRPSPQAQGGPREAQMLRSVIESNLGSRAGESASDVWRWQADGLCLRADLPGLGPQQLQLPYALEDSRLEQRAAMQLSLARRYPKAAWLTPFRLVAHAPQDKGGAKFYAIWTEEGMLKGQLWIPTKGDGPLVRVRIDTALPAQSEAGARAAALVERELAALAARWGETHE